ncbi:ROK family protein [Sphingobacterium lumbrici]|uniref:ROK family protein n=1 Tax=Sphingobacterium lumbrici TaxID=2559600 RepID=UPI00112E200A|nr:ROK family protein [Sphingobacterium lumbrici]
MNLELSILKSLYFTNPQSIADLSSNIGKSVPNIKKTVDNLLDAAISGYQIAIEAINKIGYMLGKGVATLMHIINPAKIIISGRGAKAGAVLSHQIQSAVLEFSIHRLSEDTTVEISKLKNAQRLGAACIAVEHSEWKDLKLDDSINLTQQTQ